MGEVKLSIETENLKELLADFSEALEEMGSIVLRRGEPLPEDLDSFLLSKGAYLFQAGHTPPKGLIEALVEEEQDEVIEHLLRNEENCQRIIDLLQDKGYQISKGSVAS